MKVIGLSLPLSDCRVSDLFALCFHFASEESDYHAEVVTPHNHGADVALFRTVVLSRCPIIAVLSLHVGASHCVSAACVMYTQRHVIIALP